MSQARAAKCNKLLWDLTENVAAKASAVLFRASPAT
jgi:hypothetical protein